MDSNKGLASVQIGKEFIPILKELAKADGRSMRKYVEFYIIEKAEAAGLITKNS